LIGRKTEGKGFSKKELSKKRAFIDKVKFTELKGFSWCSSPAELA
jgi:hypothetical protein